MNTTQTPTYESIAQDIARGLIRLTNSRSFWIDHPAPEASEKARMEVVAEADRIRALMNELTITEQARINNNLYHLNRAAVAGDIEAANRAYDDAKDAGIFG